VTGRLGLLRRQLPDRPRDLWDLLRTPPGRDRLRIGASWLAWPVLGPLAALRRRTVLRRTTVVAVVGSYGKTTTTRAVAVALGLGEEPECENSWSYLAWKVLRHRAGSPLVIEVGISRPGQMRAYARMLRPDIVVVTSVGGEHRISLDGIETVQREKSRMVSGLAQRGVAILNGDDAVVEGMAPLAPGRVVRFGLGERNDVRAEEVRLDWPRGTTFVFSGPGFRLAARVGLIGVHSLGAALAAVAVGRELGLPPETIVERLSGLTPTPGRMQPVLLPSGAILLRDDFKSGLETIHAALETLSEIPANRRIAAFGDITEPERPQAAVYRRLGERTASVASRILYVGHKFGPFASGARQRGLALGDVTAHADVNTLAEALRAELREGDVVLLKGRTEQKLGRAALILSGRTVKCTLRSCHVRSFLCEACPLLEKGWGTRRQVT
jgi:UDP-N-acetylmuramoyl-tripeptide--D-alanyl-D-alanine ligase